MLGTCRASHGTTDSTRKTTVPYSSVKIRICVPFIGKSGLKDVTDPTRNPGCQCWRPSRGVQIQRKVHTALGRRPIAHGPKSRIWTPKDHYKPATLPPISTHRRQHKPPLRGGRVTAVTRRPQADTHTGAQRECTTRLALATETAVASTFRQVRSTAIIASCAAFVLAGCARFTAAGPTTIDIGYAHCSNTGMVSTTDRKLSLQ